MLVRTTLDIDDQLLAIARTRAQERGISLGAAVSELIRRGLETPQHVAASGFLVFDAGPEAREVTDEMVQELRDEFWS